MAKLRIYNQIVDEEGKACFESWGIDAVCYKDIPEFLESMADDDNEIDLRIHCPGGDCIEGWAIYDALRNSGKTISATIEGECSSMATIILLAAPKERRFGYANARVCIHNPSVQWIDLCSTERLTADELNNLKAKLTAQETALLEEQNKILNLYVERTGAEREELQALMNEDKFISMSRAIELGFVASTLAPNTDSKSKKQILNNKKMAKEQITIANRTLKKILSLAGIAKIEDVQILDQKITAADGTEFTVEREDGDPQVGDKAYPNGTYVLEDGTTIVVADEVIESITPADEEGKGEGEGEGEQGTEDLKAQVDDLTKKVADLTEQVTALTADNEALSNDKATLEDKVSSLEAEAKTEEEVAILDIVAKAGGKTWLEGLKNMSSTFTASNRKFVAHGDAEGSTQQESRAQKMIREQRERQEAKRKARKN